MQFIMMNMPDNCMLLLLGGKTQGACHWPLAHPHLPYMQAKKAVTLRIASIGAHQLRNAAIMITACCS
jgi:hypothetical protein